MQVKKQRTATGTRLSARPFLAILIVTATTVPAKGNPRAAGKVVVERGVSVPMTDGVHLVADLFLPADARTRGAQAAGTERATKYPAVLARTPYGREVEGTFYGEFFAQRGYVFIAQDVRGRFDSQGEWYPFKNEKRDGSDTIDWIARQEWSNGNVAMFGASYGAMSAWHAATTGNPHLRAVIAQVSVNDPDRFMPYCGGAFHVGFAGWARMLEAIEKTGSLGGIPPIDWDGLARVRPLSDADDFLGTTHVYVDEILAHPPSDRAFWRPLSYLSEIADHPVAALHIGAWFDGHRGGTFDPFRRMRTNPKSAHHQHLLVGPWAHMGIGAIRKIGHMDFGESALLDVKENMLRFLDHYVKGERNGLSVAPRVHYFVLGENAWRSADMWPPAGAEPTELRLANLALARTRRNHGSLARKKMMRGGHPFEELRYDPKDPPALQGTLALYPVPQLTEDKSKLPDRENVLDYRSTDWGRESILAGPVRVRLYVSTNATDTDAVVELFRVNEDGEMLRLTGSIQRLRYRKGGGSDEPVPPGEVVEVALDCPDIAIAMKESDRLHLSVSSAAVPAYAPHTNTLDPLATATHTTIAETRIWHTEKHISTLTVSEVRN